MQFVFPTPRGAYDAAIECLKTRLADEFPGRSSVPRRRFVMTERLADKVLSEQKSTTIRYDRDSVEYPAGPVLPLFAAAERAPQDEYRCLAGLRVLSVRYSTFEGLTEADARSDGFSSLDELLATLQQFYGRILPEDMVCIYEFALEPTATNPKPLARNIALDAASV
ncbi:ASCH domain-containing protein [Aminobacter sp. MDW-2]|uniref:ASCH domain-containing protein n=1 Tax=Aminobacter sp. MDW-2 TaxID=2666139 RepID=UPI0012B01D25|nr:ASCH domain-containing protein [Aminobacter sp. MDW-2]MRX37152.1 ASCH domain-containing protein [Aminobacter sp. MDW-2]QNH33297.1 ASCH domain-containing protein [Aminobacter sp. MDW-2]